MPTPRKPRALEVHEGGRGKQKTRAKRVQAAPSSFDSILKLSAEEQKVSARLLKVLDKSRIGMEPNFGLGVAMMAQLVVEIDQLRADIGRRGKSVRSVRDGTKKNPALSELRECRRQLFEIMKRYGMTAYDWERVDTDLHPPTSGHPDRGDQQGGTDQELEDLITSK